MISTIKAVFGTLLFIGVLLALSLAAPTSVNAQTENELSNDTAAANFTYEAQPGDSLTVLVRKSLQLYVSNADIEIDTAQTIAAETCAVNELGAYLLDVGQEVTIPESTIVKAVSDISELSEDAKQRWLAYAPITEDLPNVRPISAPEYVPAEQLATNSEDNPDTTAQSNDDDRLVEVVSETQPDDDDNAPWYWWIIGASAVGAMWYILGGNEIIATRMKNRS